MDNFNIVQVLGVGLSGFGFLLMYLAYRLISQAMNNPAAAAGLKSSIHLYMLICFVMTITVGIFAFVNARYKNDLISSQAKDIQTSAEKIQLLTASTESSMNAANVVSSLQNPEKAMEASAEQEKALDSLSVYIARNDPQASAEFKTYKTAVLSISDSLKMKDLKPAKKDSLKASYQKYNALINKVSIQAADKIKTGEARARDDRSK